MTPGRPQGKTPGELVAEIIERHLAGLSEEEYDRILLQVERLMRERAVMAKHEKKS